MLCFFGTDDSAVVSHVAVVALLVITRICVVSVFDRHDGLFGRLRILSRISYLVRGNLPAAVES